MLTVTVSDADLVMTPPPIADVAVTVIAEERGILLSALGLELEPVPELEEDMEPHPTPQSATPSRQRTAKVVFHRRRKPSGRSKPASATLAAAACQCLTPKLLACFWETDTVRVTTDGVTPSSVTVFLLNVQLTFAGSDPQESCTGWAKPLSGTRLTEATPLVASLTATVPGKT